jgi:hypothetical protein
LRLYANTAARTSVTLLACMSAVSPGKAQSVSPNEIALPPQWYASWYQWESPDSIILQHADNRVGGQRVTARFNIKTGEVKPLNLPESVETSMANYRSGTPFRLSPDGTWLLGVLLKNQYYAIDVKSAAHLMLHGPTPLSFWTPDGTGFLSWWQDKHGTHFLLYSFPNARDGSDSESKYTVAIPERSLVVGLASANSVMTASLSAVEDGKVYDVRTYDLAAKANPGPAWSLRIPRCEVLAEASISPDLSHVCWLAACRRPSAGREASGEPPLVAELWCGSVSGADQHCVAQIDLHGMTFGDYVSTPGKPFLNSIQWTPDGRNISYTYKGRIWTVDVSQTVAPVKSAITARN